MSEMYLTDGMLEVIGWLRGRPVKGVMCAHLLALFGEGGEVALIAAEQEAAWAACPYSNENRCYNDSCGVCAPYRYSPLLDEVLADIQSLWRGVFRFDEKGEPIAIDPEELPF